MKEERNIPKNVCYCYIVKDKALTKFIFDLNVGLKEKYTGRMLVDLSKPYPRKMEYQWNGEESNSEKIISKPFIKRENVYKNQENFFSEVVEELLPRDIGFI